MLKYLIKNKIDHIGRGIDYYSSLNGILFGAAYNESRFLYSHLLSLSDI